MAGELATLHANLLPSGDFHQERARTLPRRTKRESCQTADHMKGNGQNTHELTRIEAYLLSEKAGHPSHMHDYFWTQAEAIVRQRVTAVGAAKTSAKPPAKTAESPRAKPQPAGQKAKKTPDAQLPLGDVAVAAKPKAAAPKPKPVAPAKKKAAPASSKAAAKPISKPK